VRRAAAVALEVANRWTLVQALARGAAVRRRTRVQLDDLARGRHLRLENERRRADAEGAEFQAHEAAVRATAAAKAEIEKRLNAAKLRCALALQRWWRGVSACRTVSDAAALARLRRLAESKDLIDAFVQAVRKGSLQQVEALVPQLLQRKIGVDVVVSLGKGQGDTSTAFSNCCALGHLDSAKYLAACGADVELRNPAGWAPLHRACLRGHFTVAQWLCKSSKKILRATNAKGSTAAHCCVPAGRADIMDMLSRCDPQIVQQANDAGDTPLHFAVTSSKPTVVDILLRRAPDLDLAANSQGLTPPQLAAQNGDAALVNIFRRHHAKRRGDAEDEAKAEAKARKKKKKPAKPKRSLKKKKDDSSDDASEASDDSERDDWARRDRRSAKAFRRCDTLRQALPLAWKAASDDACERVSLRKGDVETILTALAVLAEDEGPASTDAFDECPFSPATRGGDVATFVLTSGAAATESLQKAASLFRLPILGLDVRRAKVGQRRVLELVRGPAAALRLAHERAQSKPLADFGERDLCAVLRCCGAPRETVPVFDVSISSLKAWLRAHDAEEPPPSAKALLYARARFHVALLLRLAEWEQMRPGQQMRPGPPPAPARRPSAPGRDWAPGDAAGSGAALALQLQRQREANEPPPAWMSVSSRARPIDVLLCGECIDDRPAAREPVVSADAATDRWDGARNSITDRSATDRWDGRASAPSYGAPSYGRSADDFDDRRRPGADGFVDGDRRRAGPDGFLDDHRRRSTDDGSAGQRKSHGMMVRGENVPEWERGRSASRERPVTPGPQSLYRPQIY